MGSLSLSGINEMSLIHRPSQRVTLKHGLNNMQHYRKIIEDALEQDEFQLVYQPQSDRSGHRVIGVEALLRWHSTEFGVVSPTKFIPIAEELNLISDIGDVVIRKASAQLAAWKARYKSQLRMAMNVSYMQVHNQKILETLDQCITRFDLEPGDLEIELTESSLVIDENYVIGILNEIKQMGVRTAIDDFGTGYSSLSNLANLPFDLLKIDRSFITNIGSNHASTTITESIIRMAKSLDMEVLAEGVETRQQKQFLVDINCDMLQGYLISQPVAANQIPNVTGMTRS